MGTTAQHRITYPELKDGALARDDMQRMASSVEVALNTQRAALSKEISDIVTAAVQESADTLRGQIHGEVQALATRITTETDRKLEGKLDTEAFHRYMATAPSRDGGGGSVNVRDNGDGTVLIG